MRGAKAVAVLEAVLEAMAEPVAEAVAVAGLVNVADLQQSQEGGDRHRGGEVDHLVRDGELGLDAANVLHAEIYFGGGLSVYKPARPRST